MQTNFPLSAAILAWLSLAGIVLPVWSQSAPEPPRNQCLTTAPDSRSLLQQLISAKNAARQEAEAANGGVSVYSAEPAMHGSVRSPDLPCQIVKPGIWRFAFRGGEIIAVNARNEFDRVSVVLVDTTTAEARITLEFNGSLEEYRAYRGDRNLPAY